MPVIRPTHHIATQAYELSGWYNSNELYHNALPPSSSQVQSYGTYSDETPSPLSQNINVSDRDAASDRAYTSTPDSASPSEFSPNVPKKKRGGRRAEERVPRPRNAFIIFRSYYINSLKINSSTNSVHNTEDDRRVLKTKCALSTSTDNQQNELSKQAAKVWNKMNLEERQPYAEQAKKEKEWHRTMYPDYMYCPANANGKGKRTKSKVKERAKSREKEKETLKAESSTKEESAIPPNMKTERFLFQHEFENPYPSVLAPAISQPTLAPVSNATEKVAFQYSTAPSAEVEVIHSWGSDYCVDKGGRQLEQENYSQNGFLSKHDFIPMGAIPPLALCPSSSGFEEASCTDDKFPDLRQPAFAVDLSPRSLAYEQAKTLLDSQSCSPTSVFAFFAMQGGGGGDTNASSFSNTSEEAIQTTLNAPFLRTPTPFVSANPGSAAYFPPSSSFDYSSFRAEPSAASMSTTVPESTTAATTIPDWTENPTCFDFNFSSSYVEPVPMSFFEPPATGVDDEHAMFFELEIDVPQFDFQLLDDSSDATEGMLDAFFNFGVCEWL